jgi:hypothetical protein
MTTMTDTPKRVTKKQTAKDKGVPDRYLNPATGKFRVGADATYKRDLVAAALEAEAEGKRTSDAHKALQRMGWTKFLDASRASRKAKAAKKANRKEDAAKTE